MKKNTILILGLSLLLSGVMAFAQGPGRGFGPGGPGGPGARGARGGEMAGMFSPMLARLLELTEDQRAAIRNAMEAAREQSKPLREQLRDLRQQAADAVKANAPEATFDTLGDQMGAIEGDLHAIALKTRSNIHNNILTAEQRTKLEELKAEMEQRRENRRENRPGRNTAPQAPAPAPQA